MRRLIVVGLGMVLIGAMLGGSASQAQVADEFPYGVGSNDVRAVRANVWTQTSAPRLLLEWSNTSDFSVIVGSETFDVSSHRDGTVWRRILHLVPATTYYYRFTDTATAETSRVGRFTTAPPARFPADVTFTFSGDQDGNLDPGTGEPCFNNFESFNPAAADDPDFYVNLGDTIYSDSGCAASPDTTLDDYRASYKQNLTYPSLRDLRAQVPFITQWDDHEVRNDFDISTVDPTLFANGRRAFIEYQGMAKPGADLGFYRTFRYGSELEVFVLDERSFRTTEADRMDVDADTHEDCENATTHQPDLAPTLKQSVRDFFAAQLPGSGLDQPVPPQCLADLNAVDRTMLGAAQRDQFESDLLRSTATFKVVMTEDPIQQFFALPYDRWEGYRWERDQILSYIDDNNIDNVVWLATDIHADIAHVVNRNTDTPGIGTQVQGMIEYTIGPIATNVFAREINAATGSSTANGKVRGFLLNVNKNFCAQLGRPTAPFIYGYGWVHIDASTHTITIEPKDQDGNLIAGNGVAHHGVDFFCHNYVATAT